MILPKRFLISPPFGNYFSHQKCLSVKGTYTVDYRPGLVYRSLTTIRPVYGGWRNKVGLRNKGIQSVCFKKGLIYSVCAVKGGDWDTLRSFIPDGTIVELNLSCPNIKNHPISIGELRDWTRNHIVIAKLPPTTQFLNLAYMCVESGVRILHLSNTLPCPQGGISGHQLKEINLPIIEVVAKRFPKIEIVAGGGIYSLDDIASYKRAGATYFSLSTVWFNPMKALSMLSKYRNE